MSQVQNLWPTEFGEVTERTPISILREQGQALGERTANIVVGRVESSSGRERDQFRHFFYLYCPPMGYKVTLLYVDHGIDLYPATITVTEEAPTQPIRVDTPDQFIASLRAIFAQEKVKRIIASLIAQNKE